MTEPDYRPVAIRRYVDMVHAFMAAPQADGRFTGTLAQRGPRPRAPDAPHCSTASPARSRFASSGAT